MDPGNPFTSSAPPTRSHFSDGNRPPVKPAVFRWRLIPTLLLVILGSFMSSVGLLAAGMMFFLEVFKNTRAFESHLFGVCLFYLGTGTALLLTACAMWRQFYWTALMWLTLSTAIFIGTLWGFGD